MPLRTTIRGSYIPAARSSHSFPYLRSQAYGALIVDAKDVRPDPQERIFAIGETYDFQFIPATAGDYVLVVGNPGNPNAKPPIPQRIDISHLINVVE